MRRYVIETKDGRKLKPVELVHVQRILGRVTAERVHFTYEASGNFTADQSLQLNDLPYVRRVKIRDE